MIIKNCEPSNAHLLAVVNQVKKKLCYFKGQITRLGFMVSSDEIIWD